MKASGNLLPDAFRYYTLVGLVTADVENSVQDRTKDIY
jgi:hypothetical protein